jgi:hypothetical protein
MHRKLKVLGVALVALFALGAVASSALAEGLITPGISNATITASQIGKIKLTIGSTGARTVECSIAHFDSTTTTSAAGSSNVIVGTEFKECITSPGGGPATVSSINCDLNVTATSSTSKEGSIILQSKSSESAQCDLSIIAHSTSLSRICEYTVPNQTAAGSIKYASVAGSPSDVVISFNSTQVTLHVLFGSAVACGGSAGSSTLTGRFDGEVTVTAEQKVGESSVATSLVIS